MNEEKSNIEAIKIKPNDKYEDLPILDVLSSSMNETINNINNIHSEISSKIISNNNDYISNKEEEKINEEFNNAFNYNSNEKNLFEFINDINKNHIKKYKMILNFLNLNLSIDKSIKKEKENEKDKQIEKNNNIKISQSNDKKEFEIINENQEKKDVNISIKEINERDDNKLEINEINEDKNICNEKIKENDSVRFLDSKENIIYKEGNNRESKFQNKKFFINDDIEQDNDIEEEIIVNENDDSISNINIDDSDDNNFLSNNSLKNLENNSNNKLEQKTIINDNFDDNFVNKVAQIIKEETKIIKNKESKINIEDNVNKNDENQKNEEKNNQNNKKEKIHINIVQKRLMKKNNTNNLINLTYTGTNNNKDICTCEIF